MSGDRGTPPGGGWMLALHSSSETLGVGLQRLEPGGSVASPPLSAAFPLGRALSNRLFDCIESMLPASLWPRLQRLAVATGPGGFTGTRLTVVLARTLAQQLAIPLDGVSSFRLVARRLQAGPEPPGGAFWLVQELPRHGWVAGLYEPDPEALGAMAERLPPRLYRSSEALEAAARSVGCVSAPRLDATSHQPDDVEQLLAFARAGAAAGLEAPWQPVLPIYPTSPVGAQ